MMRKLLLPALVVMAAIFGAVTLMATGPELTPTSVFADAVANFLEGTLVGVTEQCYLHKVVSDGDFGNNGFFSFHRESIDAVDQAFYLV